MNATRAPNSFLRDPSTGAPMRFAVALFVAALVYAGVALANAPDITAAVRGLVFPLRLFLIAIAPTIAGVAFLWSDRAIGDRRRRRLTRILVAMLCGYAGLIAVTGGPW
jgi:hypothetical protein